MISALGKSTALGSCNGPMDINMSEVGLRINAKDMELYPRKMDAAMKVNGVQIRSMALEKLLLAMASVEVDIGRWGQKYINKLF